jgi:hypothetical protein
MSTVIQEAKKLAKEHNERKKQEMNNASGCAAIVLNKYYDEMCHHILNAGKEGKSSISIDVSAWAQNVECLQRSSNRPVIENSIDKKFGIRGSKFTSRYHTFSDPPQDPGTCYDCRLDKRNEYTVEQIILNMRWNHKN